MTDLYLLHYSGVVYQRRQLNTLLDVEFLEHLRNEQMKAEACIEKLQEKRLVTMEDLNREFDI